MRVAIIADWFAPRRGGIESQLAGLTAALHLRGVTLGVLTATPGPDRIGHVAVTRLGGARLPGTQLALYPGLRRRIATALAEFRPDLVHVHPSIVAPVCLAGVQAARDLDLPLLATFHSLPGFLPQLLRVTDRGGLWRRPDVQLSAVSAEVARPLDLLAPASPVIVLPNGIDHGFWSSGPPPAWPVPGAPFHLVTAMRIERKKRPLALLRLLPGLERLARRTGRPIHLTIAGDGALQPMVERMARRHAQGGKRGVQVHLPGWLDAPALAALYAGAQAFILPTVHESFGIAPLEARVAGLPVVTRARAAGEYLTHGLDGFLCDTDAALARAIEELACDPVLWQSMAGARPALARHDWPEVAARHIEVYDTLINRRAQARRLSPG